MSLPRARISDMKETDLRQLEDVIAKRRDDKALAVLAVAVSAQSFTVSRSRTRYLLN